MNRVSQEYTSYQKSKLMKELAKKAHGDHFIGQTSSAVYPEIANRIKTLALPTHSSLLDAGCGNGCFSHELAQQFPYKLIGVDLSGELIKEASALADEKGLSSRCQFFVEDFTQLARFQHPIFHLILCVGSLYWGQDLSSMLKKWSHILHVDGSVLFYLNLKFQDLTELEQEAVGYTQFVKGELLLEILKNKGWIITHMADETLIYMDWLRRWCHAMEELSTELTKEMGGIQSAKLMNRFNTYLQLAEKDKVKRIILQVKNA